jgi:beta-lactamase superfamily II metal-dependent hydrolase
MLLAAVALLAFVVPQSPTGGSPTGGGSLADAPVGLTVVMVDVGQGDGVVVRAPDGTVHVFDAGPEGAGVTQMLPAIAQLQPSGYGFTVLSHFHTDHIGGLDDVLSLPFHTALDRGDVNRASNSSINSYLAAAGPRRQQVVVGTVYALGGGATMRCLTANGSIAGGGFVNPAASQEENARSVAVRLDYGSFSMWIGGDLTGGGNGTADVESPAALACGDVDVYKLNHHGSNTSTNQNLVVRLSPELAVVSCGVQNSYGHPTTNVVNRINQAAAARVLLSTTTGSANTIGFGVTGSLRLDTDGFRYRATAANGSFLDFYCDEHVPPPLAAGAVRISEVHRNPAIVPDTNGEYVEVVSVGPSPVALAGMRLTSASGAVTLASNLMLVPGRPVVFQTDGAPSRNGGQPLGVPLPFSTIALGDVSDSIVLQQGTTTLDALSYSAGFPGGSGVAAERQNLFAPHFASGVYDYAPATAVFGSGDRGSPGRGNDADSTAHGSGVDVTLRPDRFTVHATAFDHALHFSVIGLANAANGFPFGGAWIPLDFDGLFQAALGVDSVIALVPMSGYRSLDIGVPSPNPVAGVPLFAAHVVLDFSLQVPAVSSAKQFVLP